MLSRVWFRSIVGLIFLVASAVIFPPTSWAESAKIELYPIQTVTLTDQEFLTGKRDGKPAMIAGELRLPRLGTDRLPAVVIVHGSGGIGGNEDRWARELNEIGVAAFTVDGFTPRGIVSVVADQSQLDALTMVNDAYRALDLLAKHPRIDSTRVGIIGGSRGGRIALSASLKRFQRTYGTAGLEFVVYLPFYAPCYQKYIDDENVSDRPIRLFHGAEDDYVPAAPCRAYVERLQRAGKNIQFTAYPGAHHSFDNPIFPLRRLPQAQTPRNCLVEEKPLGQIVNAATGNVFTWDDPCVERGVTVGYDADAHAQSIKAVKDILKEAFRLP
jgi:dienelactone hydrolase